MILKFCSSLHAKSNKPFMTSFLFFFFDFPHSAYIHFLFVIIMMYKYFVKFNLQLFITSTKIWKNGVVWYNMHDNIQSLHKFIFNIYWSLYSKIHYIIMKYFIHYWNFFKILFSGPVRDISDTSQIIIR